MAKKPQKTVRRIAKWLTRHEAKLSIAESVTAGRIQSLLTSQSGSSQFFEGGITTYSLSQKVQLLGVDKKHAAKVDCVSKKVSKEMAAGVCRLFHTDFAMAITGYAEPEMSQNVPVPGAHVSIWQASDPKSKNGSAGKLLKHKWIHADKKRRKAQGALAHKALVLLLATLRAIE